MRSVAERRVLGLLAAAEVLCRRLFRRVRGGVEVAPSGGIDFFVASVAEGLVLAVAARAVVVGLALLDLDGFGRLLRDLRSRLQIVGRLLCAHRVLNLFAHTRERENRVQLPLPTKTACRAVKPTPQRPSSGGLTPHESSSPDVFG